MVCLTVLPWFWSKNQVFPDHFAADEQTTTFLPGSGAHAGGAAMVGPAGIGGRAAPAVPGASAGAGYSRRCEYSLKRPGRRPQPLCQ